LVTTDHEVNLKAIVDVNVAADYALSSKLNFFFRVNNLGFQKFDQWLGYTSKGFNWMTGFSYSF
jgi:outer membrane cobalamin receptor